MSRQVVAKASEVAPGTSKMVTVAGREIGIFNLDGAYFALANRCPHAGGPLCDATIEGESLSCAWHGYNFSLRTGECDDDPDLHMERYEVRIEGDDVLVKV